MSYPAKVKAGRDREQSSSSKYQRCPYNPKHKVQNRNFPTHIQKCRATHNPQFLSRFVTCKYNSLHIFSIYEIGAHEMTCPNRNTMINLEEDLLDDAAVMHEELSQSQVSSHASQHSEYESKTQPIELDTTILQKKDPHVSVKICQSQAYTPEIGVKRSKIKKNNVAAKTTEADNTSQKSYNSQATQISKIKKQECVLTVKQESSVENEDLEVELKVQNKVSLTSKSNQNCVSKQRIKEQSVLKLRQKPKSTRLQNVKKSSDSMSRNDINLQNCLECSRLICDVNIKLWKNKKLVKYLKAYSKLEEQHEQIRQYIKNIPKFLIVANSSVQKQRKTLVKSPQKKANEQASIKINIQKLPTVDSKTMMVKSEAVFYADQINKSSMSDVSSSSNGFFKQQRKSPKNKNKNSQLVLDYNDKIIVDKRKETDHKINFELVDKNNKKYNSDIRPSSQILLDQNSMVIYDKDANDEEKTIKQRSQIKKYGASASTIVREQLDESLIF